MDYTGRIRYLKDFEGKVFWGLLRLSEDAVGEQFLTDQERAEYQRCKAAVRRREWLGSRIILKQILLEENIIHTPTDCLIEKDCFGRPRVSLVKDNSVLGCSISHKSGLAAACLSLVPKADVGIDVETVTSRPFRLREAFSTGNDLLRGQMSPDAYYTVLWAVKEAVSKVMGLGMAADFKRLVVIGDESKRFEVNDGSHSAVKGRYLDFGHTVVAVAQGGPATSRSREALMDVAQGSRATGQAGTNNA